MPTADRAALAERAERLRALHHAGTPLVLPNVWDAATARVVDEAGFPAVATTSAGMAECLGYADHHGTPPEEMFAAIGRVGRVLDVPLSADVEGGYGLSASDLARRLLDAGAVGCNLEDTDHGQVGGLVAVEEQAARLAAVRDAARAEGVDVVINARVDVFIQRIGEPAERVGLALDRARSYFEAGADCVYPIGVVDEADVAALLAGLGGRPLNVLPRPGGPSTVRLAEMGVARISLASRLYRASLDDFRRRVEDVKALREPS